MKSHASCLEKHLLLEPATLSDYHQLSCFHYCGEHCGPVRKIYKLVEDHIERRLCAPVVGVIVYGVPAANLAVRNHAVGGLFGGMNRADEMARFAQKFTSHRNKAHSPDRTAFILSRLTADPIYYLWHNPDKNFDFSLLEFSEHR